MNAASTSLVYTSRAKILERRARLLSAAGAIPADYVSDLIAEIDAALQRIDNGSYGLCEVCHEPIEADRLEGNPMVRFCLGHLNEQELRAHEEDLELAMQIQAKLLPPKDIVLQDWDTHYRYKPAGAVGGDYCELMVLGDGKSLFFAVGDVAGKGVAASLLMTHVSAIFRSLLSLDLPLADVILRANRLFARVPGRRSTLLWCAVAPERTAWNSVMPVNAGRCCCGGR